MQDSLVPNPYKSGVGLLARKGKCGFQY